MEDDNKAAVQVSASVRMAELRREMRHTQQECANALGVAQQTYADMEAGRCRVRRRDLVTLAVLYGLDPETAFPGMDDLVAA